ncbi:ATP-binding protein [Krasilnikovia sp. MM14-A1259]|uniref:ATP-binding protein n=1 Tax=Krasilnikovia sp. MM14-A1259 TaxID=3373539 RepID=UPI003817AFDA
MRRDQPPFLLSCPDRAGAARAGEPSVTVVGDFDTGLAEVAVSGRWDAGLKTTVAEVLCACLVAEPAGVIVDLHDLSDPAGASAALWGAARLWGAQTPPAVPVVVCLPTAAPLAAILTRCGARWHLPVFGSVPEARAVLKARAARPDRLVLHLAPDVDALPLVAQTLGEACAAWRATALYRTASAVLTELVANAIEHAGTGIDVAVTRRPAGLHLAVHDRDPRFPRGPGDVAGDPGDPGRRGYGLRLVHTTTAAWGAVPARTGKIVWATLTAADANASGPRRRARTPHPAS